MCPRCKRGDCPGCVVDVDCVGCKQSVSIDHTDAKGRCPGCVERAAAEAAADATVSPEVIRQAVVAAVEAERWACAELCDAMAESAAQSSQHGAEGRVGAYRAAARVIRQRGAVRVS